MSEKSWPMEGNRSRENQEIAFINLEDYDEEENFNEIWQQTQNDTYGYVYDIEEFYDESESESESEREPFDGVENKEYANDQNKSAYVEKLQKELNQTDLKKYLKDGGNEDY